MRHVFCLTILAVAGLAVAPAAEVVDAIVATVDTEPILQSDLTSQVAMVEGDPNMALREVLDKAIEQKILYRQALLAGLDVPETTVEERLETIRKNYNTNEEFMKALEDSGETLSDFRDNLRKQIIAVSMGMRKRSEFEKEVVITESDMRQYYQDHQDEFSLPERVQVRRLFLGATKDPADRARVRAQLEALRAELDLGADFGELAKTHSEGPDAAGGGVVGWIQRGDLVPELENEVFKLQPNELSPVIETEWGFHLLRADDREAAGDADYEEVRSQIEPVLRAELARGKYDSWLQELRKRSRVRVLM
jgi:parvulin-like peptidyl-prolyl isomerase